MNEKESTIEGRICRYVQGLGGRCEKLILASEMGFPDRTILLPGGRVLFIEIKRPTKPKVYFMQLQWQHRLRQRGFVCEFVESVEDVAKLIQRTEHGPNKPQR